MIGIKKREIDKELLMIFVICYEYSMSFTHVVKLYNISKKYFWTFLEICTPMIKMGVRKAANLRKSVNKIYDCLKKGKDATSYAELSVREEKMLEAFSWFLEDHFSDGTGCLHISQFEPMPFAKAYSKDGMLVASNFENTVYNLDSVAYIKVGDNKFYKTSKFLYLMEKYSGDTDIKELNSLSVKEMLKRIAKGEEELNDKETQEFKKYLKV